MKQKGLVYCSFYTTLQISGIILLILLFFKDFIVELFQLEGISSFLFLIPLVVLFTGITQILEQWFIRSKEFSINAKAVVLQTLIINGSKLSIGLIYPVAGVLIVLSALNSGLKALLMFLFSKRLHKQKTLGIKKRVSIKNTLKSIKIFLYIEHLNP